MMYNYSSGIIIMHILKPLIKPENEKGCSRPEMQRLKMLETKENTWEFQ